MNTNIEQRVNKILQAANFSSPQIDAEQIAEFYFNLEFDWRPLSNANILAELSVAQKKIYMNETRAEDFAANVGLRNFTIAHELGHWVLHRNLVGERSKQIEREADKFATYLLMPEDLVREEFKKIDPPFMWYDVYSLAEKFRVSVTAMMIRLSQRELKLIYLDKGHNIYRSKEEFLEINAGQMRLF